MDLIRTKYKNKISKDFSYPIGAERISQALMTVPQYGLFAITFLDRDEYQISNFKKRISEKGTVKIFEIGYFRMHKYHSSPNRFIEDGEYEPKWEIEVYAVPKEYKNYVKRAIVDQLKLIAEWLHDLGNIERYGMEKFLMLFKISEQIVKIVRKRS